MVREGIRDKERRKLLFADDNGHQEEVQGLFQFKNGELKANAQKLEWVVRREEIKQVEICKYLSLMLVDSHGCKVDNERIKVDWRRWREVYGTVCDGRISKRLKVQIYKAITRPATIYGAADVGD